MSDPVTALNGVAFTDGIADVTEVPLQGMITLRGDLSEASIAKAVKAVTGAAVPGMRGCSVSGETGVAWMSPDELLLLMPYADVAAAMKKLERALGKTHALAVDVSDARASFRVSGAFAREVLSKLCPVDLSPAAFATGQFRRTRMAQVPVAFWLCAEDAFQIICFRSQARYVFDLLKTAAQPGSEVNILQQSAAGD